ncbi:DNA invertase Pin-like site-specific DNA recombinase [Marinobacterium sp. MBR-111]|jgi:DNA invertase Pin-like site-specific DNA recombinase|uniref:recombinase family protein n=1 Tax=Marinobacterium sp. MBR-111 TaxID=3156463 RepID=UPI00339A57DB
MEFIYRRVSTADQKTDRQLTGMKADREYEDKLSGKDLNRPQLQAMLQTLREGDVVHVHELSRLGRSVQDLLELVRNIVDTGATIRFHKENLCFEPDKTDPFQQLMLTLLSSVAEFERNCILQRQREGIAIAKANGRYKGKQSRFSEGQLDQIRTEFENEKNKTALAKRWGISRGYLYKIAARAEALLRQPRIQLRSATPAYAA